MKMFSRIVLIHTLLAVAGTASHAQVAAPGPLAALVQGAPAQSAQQPARIGAPAASAQQSAPPPAQPPDGAQALSLHEAEMLALQNHPQIQAAQATAQASRQQVREVRSTFYPQAEGSLTAAAALQPSRIGAGALNNPVIFNREADGVSVSQLITDFGRTHELSRSSSFHAQAQEENIVASRADVLLGVDRAFFQVLRAQAVLRVAQETVLARQTVSDQITTMARNQLKSTLDVSFANVDLSQAQLLLIQAQNDVQAGFAALSAALGYPDQRVFALTDEPLPAAPPPDPAPLIAQAIENRPELISQRYDVNSAKSYATAERDLSLPTFSALGAAGLIPLRQDTLPAHYAAAGVNLNIPIFNGHLFGALYSEAKYRADAQQQTLRNLQDSVVRDVRVAWLNANSAYQRLSVTEQLLAEATQAMNLAQARYNLGLSSIVELTQAQLNLTQAEIVEASAKYDYQDATAALNFAIGNLPLNQARHSVSVRA